MVINRFPDNASRQLEAAYLCGLEEVGVSVALKQYSIDLIANEMKEDSGKVRNVKRIELEKTDRGETAAVLCTLSYSFYA